MKVAVLDSGTSAHTDLKRNLQKGTDTVAGGDGSGRVDSQGHGTQMAGIIAGHGHGSGDGVIGIAPEAKVVPVKVIGGRDNGAGLVAGIKWATEAGVGVINVSASAVLSRGLITAVAGAVDADTVVVASSGNKAKDLLFAYPAAIPEVLAVGAVDRNGGFGRFLRDRRPDRHLCARGRHRLHRSEQQVLPGKRHLGGGGGRLGGSGSGSGEFSGTVG
nr:hypothetical protein Ade03nite_89270 [Actinoplanes derwentensis]